MNNRTDLSPVGYGGIGTISQKLAHFPEDVRGRDSCDQRECGQGMGWLWSNDTVVAVLEFPLLRVTTRR